MRTTTLAEIPVFKDIQQATRAVRRHALVVNLDGNDACTLGLDRVGSIHVDEQLAQHGGTVLNGISSRIPRLDDELNGLVEAVGRATGEDDLGAALVGHRRVQVVASKLAEERGQRRVSRGGAVLESSGEVNLLEGIILGVRLGDSDVRGRGSVSLRRGRQRRVELDRCKVGRETIGVFLSHVRGGSPAIRPGDLRLERIEGKQADIGQA